MTDSIIDRARRGLGTVGAIVGVGADAPAVGAQQDGVRRLEAAGWPAVWTNEIVGADALVRASLWLAATEHLVIGTGIANMWARPPQTAHAAATQLAQAYPGRFVLGLGVGRPEQAAAVGRDYGSPITTARTYLDGAPGGDYPRLLAANGPRMLDIAARCADGAFPAGRPPSDTAAARSALGPEKLLVVYVPLSGSDTTEPVVDAVHQHREAGADHVVVGQSYDTDFVDAVEYLTALAPALGLG